MSRPIVFSFVEGFPLVEGFPHCDICGEPTTGGAVAAHFEGRPGLAAFVACTSCAVEISCIIVREFWPRAPPDPPPESPPASGGGSA